MQNNFLKLSATALLLSSLTSCNDSQAVRTIDVNIESSTVVTKKEKKMKGLPEGANLILGAIIPTSSSQWFVKLAGPSSEFNEVKDLLDKLIDTIDFDDYSVEVVNFDLPDGWVKQHEQGFLHSSISKEGLKSRVTISKASGTVLDNVNRWNRQLGNGAMDERQLMQVSQKQVINGRFGILVVLAKHDGSTGRELRQADAPNDPHHGHAHAKDPHHGHDHSKNPHGDSSAMNDAQGIRIAFADVNGQTWYIKLKGSANTLITEKANFEEFVKSFKYEGDSASWKAPAAWKSLGAGGMIKETFDAGGAKATIVTLPVGGGSVESNVNRWRGQIGLGSISADQINKQMQKLTVGSVNYNYLFISTGSQVSAPKVVAPAGGQISQSGINFTLPAGWTTVAASGMRKVNLLADGIPVTGISLGAAAKGLKKNVDRWCGQIDMDKPTEEELAAMTEKVDFSGGKADLVVLKGKEKSILALIFDEKDSVWFFKAMGDTKKILAQKDNFSAFVKSVKLPGGDQ